MNRSKQRVAIIGALAVLLAGFSAATSAPSASGQGGSGAVTAIELSGPVEPVAGWSGEAPTLTPAEAGLSSTVVIPTDAHPAEAGSAAESVIGPDGRTQVTNTTGPPAFAIGQIVLVQQGDPFICTGWLIDPNSILSAGHCAFDPSAPPGQEIIESATWYPGRNGATDPIGGCAVSTVWAPPTEWVINGQPYFDFSVMNFGTLVAPGSCANVGATTGTFGLYANATRTALNNVRAIVQGYPGDQPDGTHWRMGGRIHHANKRFTFYPMDTAGGQSGSPVWWNRTAGACTGACGYAVHAYGVGIGGQNLNGGPRLTAFRLGQIADAAGQNNP